MRIGSSCSHHRATSMITRREPIFQISARSVICDPVLIRVNPALTDSVYWSCIVFGGWAYLEQFIWSTKTHSHKKVPISAHTNEHMHKSSLPALSALKVANILRWAEVHRPGKHLAIIGPCGRPVNPFSALTWECVERYELLHNYMKSIAHLMGMQWKPECGRAMARMWEIHPYRALTCLERLLKSIVKNTFSPLSPDGPCRREKIIGDSWSR